MVVYATVDDPERTIAFEAVFNFRDLGGYRGVGGRPVRWRTLFRADGLHRLNEAESERLRELGIVTVIDLRTPDEVADRGRVPDAVVARAYHHLPMFDVVPDWSGLPDVAAPGFLADRYTEMLETGRSAVATALELLADPESLPAVFHCAAGKDRTGILAAIVLELLGVDRATVVADYARSHEAMARLDAWLARTHPEFTIEAADRPAAVLEARPETMERFLAAIDGTYGSVDGLVAELGVDRAIVAGLRANLLT
jgi:protein-tyrosine phosphatase